MKKINLSRNAWLFSLALLSACSGGNGQYDATGTFEADEVIVSAEAAGRILQLQVEEGMNLDAGQPVGLIDSTQLHLTLAQLKESKKAFDAGKPDVRKQMEATRKEIENAKSDQQRFENLVRGNVATQKQLDDVNTRLAVLQARLEAQENSLHTTTGTLEEQGNANTAQQRLVEDQLSKCRLINPVKGTVIARYALPGEVTAMGKPLYKIADLSALILRAYVTGDQLATFKVGQKVQVIVDDAGGESRNYSGTIRWVSDKAEFTPKTIQTKDERANLVYAMKIVVPNDGYLKLGMYGEVVFNPSK